MNTQKTATMLYFSVLLLTGKFVLNLTNVSLIVSAVISGVIGFFMSKMMKPAFWAGLIFMSLLVFYFGSLTIFNSNGLVDMLINGKLQLKPYRALHTQTNMTLFSAVAFLLSIVVSMIQFVRANSNGRELSS
jgi:hypothetical protein